MNEHSAPSGEERGVAGPGPAGRQRWRTILAVVLIVVGYPAHSVCGPLGHWANRVVLP